MSGKRIVEVVEEWGDEESPGFFCVRSRRTLTEGQYVLIEKVDGRWAVDALNAVASSAVFGTRPALVLDTLTERLNRHRIDDLEREAR